MNPNGRSIVTFAEILLVLTFVARCLTYAESPADQSLGDDWWEVESCVVHDLDTWTSALVRHGKTNTYSRESLRLRDCDACEVSYARQAKLKEQKAELITEEEIQKGKSGTAEFKKLTEGGTKFVRVVDADAAYGRWEVEMRVVMPGGKKVVDVRKWIRDNGYERPTKK